MEEAWERFKGKDLLGFAVELAEEGGCQSCRPSWSSSPRVFWLGGFCHVVPVAHRWGSHLDLGWLVETSAALARETGRVGMSFSLAAVVRSVAVGSFM